MADSGVVTPPLSQGVAYGIVLGEQHLLSILTSYIDNYRVRYRLCADDELDNMDIPKLPE